MPSHKKSHKSCSEQQMQYLMENVTEAYRENTSLRALAAEFDMTLLKIRKLLITTGAYSSEVSEQVNTLYKSGKSIIQIMKITGLSRASVYSYLPYQKGIYNMNTLSLDAERCKIYRNRKAAVDKLRDVIEKPDALLEATDMLWKAIVEFEDYPFVTAKGLKFRYTIRRREGVVGNEMFVNRKEKSITKSSVEVAFKKALELDRVVTGPKKLGVFGASYLYPIFIRIGIIKKNGHS